MDYQVPLDRLTRPRPRSSYRLDVILFMLLALLLLLSVGLSPQR